MAYVSLHPIVEAIESAIEAVEDLEDVDAEARATALNQLGQLKSDATALCATPGDSYQMLIAEE